MAHNLLLLYIALPLIASHDHKLSPKQANRYLYSFSLVVIGGLVSWPFSRKRIDSRMGPCGRFNGHLDIFPINPDGTGIRRLTENSGNNEAPTWLPHGRFIAVSSTREGPSRIYVMNANGANQRRLTSLRGKESSPT